MGGIYVTYNAVKVRSSNSDCVPSHIRERETPLSIYLAIKLYAMTRKEAIIDILHQKGLCISYKRLRSLTTDIANSVIAHYEKTGPVVPLQAKHGLFTTLGFDNIDHNLRATTSRSSFHGTCISLLQFPTTEANEQPSDSRDILNPEVMGKNRVDQLPNVYTDIQQVTLPKEDIHVPLINGNPDLQPIIPPLKETLKDAYDWLMHSSELLAKETTDTNEWISWAAYNANKFRQQHMPITPSLMFAFVGLKRAILCLCKYLQTFWHKNPMLKLPEKMAKFSP